MKFRLLLIIIVLFNLSTSAQSPQIEKIDRGVVAVKVSSGVYIGWRYLHNDNPSCGFNIYRDGEKLNSKPITTSTNYTDSSGDKSATYVIKRVDNGRETDASTPCPVWDNFYRSIPVKRPAAGVTPPYTVTNVLNGEKYTEEYPNGQYYSYTPCSCSVGDVDGDSQYEIVLKWEPTNMKDNSLYGYTGNVYLDCYEMDGTQLWRIDLGRNIRAGNHYTQFMVYDLDGDGKAEVACKTAPGTIDGAGNAVLLNNDEVTADYRNSKGMVITGSEYLTVFDGMTGAELTTVSYDPPRGSVSAWGNDSYGNRSERYLACIAYLDGLKPSLIMCRGYYERTALAAYNFDGEKLTQRWLHDSKAPGEGAYGQGNHNLSVGDVDDDGRDEIIYGACVIDDDGSLLYRTGWGHGDAMHLSDMDPDTPGLEVFCVHEETTAAYGWEMHKAGTGELLFGEYTGSDVGRGVAADIDGNYRGFEIWSSESGVRSCTGKNIGGSTPSLNFRVYWDEDLQDELFDRSIITKWNSSKRKASTLISLKNYANATDCSIVKYTPNLQADLIGDWREEVILWDKKDSSTLVFFTTTTPTEYRIPTLMHDHIYRMGIAWQNVAYNQPPHLGYYIGDGNIEYARLYKVSKGSRNQTVGVHMPIDTISFRWDRCDGMEFNKSLPAGITYTYNDNAKTIHIHGTPQVAGNYSIEITTIGNPVADKTENITFNVLPEDTITSVAEYKFDETSGATAVNTIYGNASASAFTPTWSRGISDGALSFAYATDSMSCMTQDFYGKLSKINNESFNISMWIKADRCAQNFLSMNGDEGSSLRIEYGSTLQFAIHDGTIESKTMIRNFSFLDGNWHHITYTRDRNDKMLYVYLNGNRIASFTDKSGNTLLNRLIIGTRAGGAPFRGEIDELLITTGAMNERQASELYNKYHLPTAIKPIIEEHSITVYPTQFTNQIHIQFTNAGCGMSTISLYNMTGTSVLQRTYRIEGNNRITFSGLEYLPDGIYTLHILLPDGQQITKKLIR